ncbi:LysR family transcriptional regulator BsrA [Chitinimonas koreensis]|uniref:LysR family transcriptional regulator BsrA n=1 Tax=Chitinimonas koreensis TaxID=356302 RepID=UPI0003FBDDC5|nr:LysR family transcriptional regulator [Chitinimonas koreensis]QNM97674.1 LysR family transcriptional regulator [Chitinimonas koreensis]
MNLKLHQLDMNLLRVFDALVQEGNLTRAAQRLHMSQPAVSNALARLRRQLDEPLFVRTARGLTPTAAAQALHGPVRTALRLLQDALAPPPAFDPASAGQRFSVAMNDYAQCALLPSLLARMRSQAPGVTLHIRPDAADDLPTQLAAGSLDLAIDYLHFDSPELSYAPLLEEQLVVIARRGHPAMADGRLGMAGYAAAEHVTFPDRAGRGSPLEIVLGSAKLRRRSGLCVPSYMCIPAVVATSDLLGTVPLRLARQFAALPIVSAPLPLAMPPLQVSLIWHHGRDADGGLQWLRRQIADTVAALTAQG